jgi:hypothetical protein
VDWLYKAALTAAVVAIVLMTVSRFRRRLGGLLAGLPVITAPAPFWLVHEQGADFAALGLACAAGLPRCMPARVAG